LKSWLCKQVQRKISHFALKKVQEEFEKARHLHIASPPCTQVFSTTMGLPCSHQICLIMESSDGQLKMDQFHKHWWLQKPRPAVINDTSISAAGFNAVLNKVETCYGDLPPHQQHILEERLMTLSQEQGLVPLQDPVVVAHPRGRPKRAMPKDNSTRREPSAFEMIIVDLSEPCSATNRGQCGCCGESGHNVRTCPKKDYPSQKPACKKHKQTAAATVGPTVNIKATLMSDLDSAWQGIVPYELIDVPSDGRCGFHAIAFHVHKGMSSTRIFDVCSSDLVRSDLYLIYQARQDFWQSILPQDEHSLLEDRLTPWIGTSNAPFRKWFTTPDCAILAATMYNRPIVVLTDQGHATTYAPYSTKACGDAIAIINIQNVHWQAGKLKTGSALPPLDYLWCHHASSAERAFWMLKLQVRLDQWRKM
jgi:hypothetical protein